MNYVLTAPRKPETKGQGVCYHPSPNCPYYNHGMYPLSLSVMGPLSRVGAAWPPARDVLAMIGQWAACGYPGAPNYLGASLLLCAPEFCLR